MALSDAVLEELLLMLWLELLFFGLLVLLLSFFFIKDWLTLELDVSFRCIRDPSRFASVCAFVPATGCAGVDASKGELNDSSCEFDLQSLHRRTVPGLLFSSLMLFL